MKHHVLFRVFVRNHKWQFMAMFAVVGLISSVIGRQLVSNEHSLTVPSGRISPSNYGSFLGINNTTYPNELNVTSQNFVAAFYLMPSSPQVIDPGYTSHLYLGISVCKKSISEPYTGIKFSIENANFSIGSYDISQYSSVSYLHHGDNETLWLSFQVTIQNPNLEGQNYSAFYNVTVGPILFFGPFQFNQPTLTLSSGTVYPWFHIAKVVAT